MSARRRVVGGERFELADDVVELDACAVVVGLSEHGPDECRESGGARCGRRERFSHRVDAAALP